MWCRDCWRPGPAPGCITSTLTTCIIPLHLAVTTSLSPQANATVDPMALHRASQLGHCEVVGVLLAARVALDQPSANGSSALLVASQQGHHDVVPLWGLWGLRGLRGLWGLWGLLTKDES